MPEQPQEMTRRAVGGLAALSLGLALSIGSAAAQCRPGPLTGEVTYVRDGDTVEVAGVAGSS